MNIRPNGESGNAKSNGRLPALIFWLFCFASPAALAQVELTDTEFDVSNDWTVFGPWINPTGAENGGFVAQQQPDGGLPGAYLQMTHTLPTVDSGSIGSWVALINEKQSWDPAVFSEGAKVVLHFQIDALRVGDSYDRVYTLAIRQNGKVWAAIEKRLFLRQDDWTTLSIKNLGALDFVPFPYLNDPDQPYRPDFSPDAPPVNVGIATGLSCPATSSCTRVVPKQSDIDNFSVRVSEQFQINPGLNDAWYNPVTNGQGFLITVFPDIKQVFVAWFTYDVARPSDEVTAMLGEPGHRWLTAQGPYEGDTANLIIFLTEGGVFDDADPAAITDLAGYGTLAIEFADCAEGLVSYEITSLGISGEIPIERIVPDNISLCEMLNSP